MARYLRTLREVLGWRAGAELALLLGLGALEGTGLVMLVPVLRGVVQGGAPNGGTPEGRIVEGLQTLGLPTTLGASLLVVVVLVLLRATLARVQTVHATQIRERVVRVLRSRLYEEVLFARWTTLLALRRSDVLQSLSTDLGRVGAGAQHLTGVLTSSILLATYLAVASLLSIPLTLCATGLGAIGLLVVRNRVREARRIGGRTTGLGKRFFAEISGHLEGLRVTKSMGAEARTLARFDALTHRLRSNAVDNVRNTADVRWAFTIATTVALAAFIYLAVRVFAAPPASMLVLLAIFARATQRLSKLQQSYQRLTNVLPAFASFEAMEKRLITAREEPIRDDRALPTLRREIRLDDVSFRYPTGDGPALTAVDLRLPAGGFSAVLGPSGAGKSTLVDILTGLVEPDEGTLLLDGRPLVGSDLAAWRRCVGYVPQETFLFHDTIRANLLWARPDATEERLREALERASAADFVRSLPEGLETVVGDRGARLSGGERQRLALARALLRQPRLLVLDEATSQLDPENERSVVEALEALRGEVTVVFATHRVRAVKNADLIVVLEEGRVTALGSWRSLAAGGSRVTGWVAEGAPG